MTTATSGCTQEELARRAAGARFADGREAGAAFPKLVPLLNYLDGLRGRADLGALAGLLEGLAVTRADIAGCCQFGTGGYRRNTIARSEWYELLALCWRSGDCTPIHDHHGVSCAFRVVEGVGTEIRFATTPAGLIKPVGSVEMAPGYVCAAEDSDIHQVCNMQGPGEDLVTLHMYSPPIKAMHTYAFTNSISPECAGQYEGGGGGGVGAGGGGKAGMPTASTPPIPC
jgi:cysteine dioxygenase